MDQSAGLKTETRPTTLREEEETLLFFQEEVLSPSKYLPNMMPTHLHHKFAHFRAMGSCLPGLVV